MEPFLGFGRTSVEASEEALGKSKPKGPEDKYQADGEPRIGSRSANERTLIGYNRFLPIHVFLHMDYWALLVLGQDLYRVVNSAHHFSLCKIQQLPLILPLHTLTCETRVSSPFSLIHLLCTSPIPVLFNRALPSSSSALLAATSPPCRALFRSCSSVDRSVPLPHQKMLNADSQRNGQDRSRLSSICL
jgi:hypothetical protein